MRGSTVHTQNNNDSPESKTYTEWLKSLWMTMMRKNDDSSGKDENAMMMMHMQL